MARKQDTDLFRALRSTGLRKKVARAVSEAASQGRRRSPTVVDRTLDNLRAATAELERHLGSSQRSEAAKKAARTRKRKAAARSDAARKAARTRAKSRA